MPILSIAVVGLPQSGGTDLVNSLNGQVIEDRCEKPRTQLHVRECDVSTLCSNGHVPEVVLVTTAVNNIDWYFSEKKTAVDLARDIQRLLRKDKVILVGTKYDLVRRDRSLSNNIIRSMPSEVAYFHDLKFCAISTVTGEGINDLKTEICRMVYTRNKGLPLFRMPDLFNPIFDRILDVIAYAFSLPIPSNVNHDTPTPPLDRSTEEVDKELSDLDHVGYDRVYGRRVRSIVPFTSTIVAKRPETWEYGNMLFVRRNTRIPVPQPRYAIGDSWLLMDRIEGQSLSHTWETLSLFMQFRIACTLRCYVKQLHSLTSTLPGHDGIVSGDPFCGCEHGPFQDSNRLRLFCEMVAFRGWSSAIHSPAYRDLPAIGGHEPWPLVFSHSDLHPGNVMLDNNNVVWLIDWAHAQFLPPWVDSIVMKLPNNWPHSWIKWTSFIAGSVPPRYDYMWAFAFSHFEYIDSTRHPL